MEIFPIFSGTNHIKGSYSIEILNYELPGPNGTKSQAGTVNLSALVQSRGDADIEVCRSRNWLHVIWWGTGSSLAFITGVRGSARDPFDRRSSVPPTPSSVVITARPVCIGDVATLALKQTNDNGSFIQNMDQNGHVICLPFNYAIEYPLMQKI